MELTLQNPALIAAKASPKAKTIVFCMEIWGSAVNGTKLRAI
jgi:hypothetical protein